MSQWAPFLLQCVGSSLVVVGTPLEFHQETLYSSQGEVGPPLEFCWGSSFLVALYSMASV